MGFSTVMTLASAILQGILLASTADLNDADTRLASSHAYGAKRRLRGSNTTRADVDSVALVDQPARRGAADQDSELASPDSAPRMNDLRPPDTVSPGPTVNVPNLGNVLGLDREEYPSVAEFRGIPYAEPPTRWQPPVMHEGWGSDTFNATGYGNICMQEINGMDSDFDDVPSEDCLFLHIGTPKSALESGSKKLPVMFWIHGGGFTLGKGSAFDTASLVAASGEQVVVVTINYRLGVFGYLGGDELMSRTDGAGAGNFGTQDQRMAMKWVKDNIGAFGGDGGDVTIFGQSAGAMSVVYHLVQPDSFPLYQKAIVESGSQTVLYDYANVNTNPTTEDANDAYKSLLNDVGCEDLDCLLKADAKSVLDADQKDGYHGWLPVIDGVSLTDNIVALFDAKLFNNQVPIILGSNSDEAANKEGLPTNMTEAEFDSLDPYSSMTSDELTELKRLYSPTVYSYYPADLGEYSIWYWMDVRIQTDWTSGIGRLGLPGHCSDRWLAQKLLEGGSTSVYNYRWEKAPNAFDEAFAVHGAEQNYVFDMMFYPMYLYLAQKAAGDFTWKDVATADDKNMGHIMASYWSNFALSGDPNPTGDASELGMVNWPKFTLEAELTLIIVNGSEGGVQIQQDLVREQCDWQFEYAQSQGFYPGGV